MLLTILVALAIVVLIAYFSLRKKETKQESEIKHEIADVEPVKFEEINEFNIPEPTFTAIAVEENNKLVKKPKTTAAKKPAAKKAKKDGK